MKPNIHDIITIDPAIQFGKPVFKGTRVPIQSLFWHLEEGYSINSFIAEFPSVKKSQVELFLNLAGNLFNNNPTKILDETFA
ncbi:MAG: DUF433 domain-containing protein [Chitinophagaceae bacterium]|jgi:uncharacterized protein (DUF433 family)|nr:DUF433 domain-containing protein [Chitinophagaceae bacterium]